jgi:arylsulfatase A-like enzyme
MKIPQKAGWIASGVLAAGVVSACTSNTGQEKQRHPQKYNILFLFADDQRADAMGCAGNTYIRTPNIDRLAQRGIRFSNAYVMGGHHGAISAPSRAMLMTGKSLFHVYDKLAGQTTMPMVFGRDGYVTFGTGKWHNEKSAFEASFQQGRNVFLGGMANHFEVPCRDLGPDGKLSEPVKKGYSTDQFADAAIGFLNDYTKQKNGKPFFCYVAFTAPHDPFSPRPDFIGRYPDGSLPLPGNYMPLHPFAFDNLTVRDENLLPWPRPAEGVRKALSDYYAMITHLDSRIGDIIETLKKNGLYDNTLIVYAGDNGLAIGSHGLIGKQDLYEDSMKVPFLICGPGIPEGQVNDALVYLFDIYPTLSEICGLPSPQGIDGKSLVDVIDGKEPGVRTSLFNVYRYTVRAVRTKDWKLIRYPERNYTQLFDLARDPLELYNLAGVDSCQPRVEQMLALMKEWQAATDDTAALTRGTLLPLEYDYRTLKRRPDNWQPEYTRKRFFDMPDGD